jgi:inner membrane protein
MDSLTHIVVGASVGEALLGKYAGKRAMFFGALAGSAPDIDAFMNFFVSDLESLILHRGITHSVFVAFIAGPLLGWSIWKYFKGEKGPLSLWMAMMTINIIIHLFLDTATMYGTMLLTPFSDFRFAFDNIFVVDPLYSVPIAISFTALLILKSDHPSRAGWNRAGLVISTIYMAFTITNHRAAIFALNESVDLSDKTKSEYFAVPTLFNSILWKVVVMEGDTIRAGYFSVFDQTKKINMYVIARNEHLESQVTDKDAIEKLKKFSKGFYCYTEKEGRIYFNDLRFGQVEGWNDPESNFAFSFDLTPGANNTMVVQQGRIEGSTEKMLLSLWTRMKGN